MVTAVRAYYESVPDGRLVVTGGPGAGKSVLAAELVLAILEGEASDGPVPVRLYLSRWDVSDDPSGPDAFARWLQERLVDEYALDPSAARALVSAHRILPVLDGLDQMDPDDVEVRGSRAASVLRALDVWLDGRKGVPFVLTCRTDRYDRLPQAGLTPSGATRIELDKVRPHQALGYLRRTERRHPHRWDPLFHELATNPTGLLATALDSPWRLTMTAVVYADDGDPGDLLRFSDAQSLKVHLLAHYVPAASRTHPDAPASKYSPDAVHVWLAWIAARLGTQSEFAPVHMWKFAPEKQVLGIAAALTAAPWLLLTTLSVFWAQSDSPLKVLAILLSLTAALQVIQYTRKPGLPPVLVVVRLPRDDSWRKVRVAAAWWLVPLVVLVLMAFFSLRDAPLRSYIVREITDGWREPEPPGAVIPRGAALFLLALVIAGPFMAVAVIATLMFLLMFASGRTVRLVPCAESPHALRNPSFPLVYQKWLVLLPPVVSSILLAIPPGSGTLRLFLLLPFTHALLLTVAPVMPRYAAFRLCTRGRLPPRPAEFLHWARGAGLLRLAGSSYQFRHRELQDWLAANPTPPTT
ncbi:NACHT domain-containing protein [Streptomyces sp. NPDC058457]|uniref:NACHT domain-containing protein n=1 Tax=Streptomyces sp. NPDC058457 TaxID=3346507 RepID=UPI003648092E